MPIARSLTALLAVVPLVSAAAYGEAVPARSDFGSLNSAAPPETAQFSFAIGEWECKTRGMQADGSIQPTAPATWTFYYILDGWAIQDDWVSKQPDGARFYGTNIRSFNPQTRTWDNRWLSAGSLQWKYFESEQVGTTMVMTGGEGRDRQDRPFIDRNTFHDITENSWKWRKDRSFDGGETWVEGVFFIDARRVR
ncbi:MAG: hypothetical protein GY769_05165 [bacterium]|nr:hypothetical protein [bacterium]